MARRRVEDAPTPPAGRPFSDAELAQIRRILIGWPDRQGHPHPGVAELEAIHASAGRRRGFKVWELDPIRTADDFERAVREELSESLAAYLEGEKKR